MQLVRKFEPNKIGRDLAVGDVHGEYETLMALLQKVNFDKAKDRLFMAGDLCDRGRDSVKVLGLLEEGWAFGVRGNHEQMNLTRDITDDMEVMRGLQHGASWAIYCPTDERHEMKLLMGSLPIAIQVGDVGIVHAHVPGSDWSKFLASLTDWNTSVINRAIWARERADAAERGDPVPPVKGIRAVIHGHNVMENMVVAENSYYIDTGACYGGKLTLLDLKTLEVVAEQRKIIIRDSIIL